MTYGFEGSRTAVMPKSDGDLDGHLDEDGRAMAMVVPVEMATGMAEHAYMVTLREK